MFDNSPDSGFRCRSADNALRLQVFTSEQFLAIQINRFEHPPNFRLLQSSETFHPKQIFYQTVSKLFHLDTKNLQLIWGG